MQPHARSSRCPICSYAHWLRMLPVSSCRFPILPTSFYMATTLHRYSPGTRGSPSPLLPRLSQRTWRCAGWRHQSYRQHVIAVLRCRRCPSSWTAFRNWGDRFGHFSIVGSRHSLGAPNVRDGIPHRRHCNGQQAGRPDANSEGHLMVHIAPGSGTVCICGSAVRNRRYRCLGPYAS